MGTSAVAAAAVACVAMFQADSSTIGRGLYANNGASTRLLLDLPSGAGKDVYYFTGLGNGSVLFSNSDDTAGRELWISRGTTGSTRLLRDVNTGVAASNPGSAWDLAVRPGGGTAYTSRYQRIGGLVLFAATTAGQGREFWVSAGTSGNTRILKDHMPGTASGVGAGPAEFIFSNGAFAIYTVRDSVRGNSLWATNGTPSGTRFLKTLTESRAPQPFGILGNRILFSQVNRQELWITDGTVAGTKMLIHFSNFQAIQNVSRVKGTTYALFSAYTPTTGKELWITDGTVAGTRLLKDINAGAADSLPGSYYRITEYGNDGAYFKIGDRVLFPATNAAGGRELWATRGTAASTLPFTQLGAGVNGAEFYEFTTLNNRLYFAADVAEGSTRVIRPFVTAGTATSTRKLSTSLRVSGRMVSLPNGVVFVGDDPSGNHRLWRTGIIAGSQVAVSPILAKFASIQNVEIPSPDGVNAPCPVN